MYKSIFTGPAAILFFFISAADAAFVPNRQTSSVLLILNKEKNDGVLSCILSTLLKKTAQEDKSKASSWGQTPENRAGHRSLSLRQVSCRGSNNDDQDSNATALGKASLEEEIERLQNQLALIEALEERNKAQLDSFVDEEDQWDSMEEEERQLLRQKDEITKRMEVLAEEMVQIWMGAKSMDG